MDNLQYQYSVPEVSIRINNPGYRMSYKQLGEPETIPDFVKEFLAESDVEHMILLCLSVDLKPINYSIISKGAITQTNFSVAELCRTALLTAGCASCIVIHNHTSVCTVTDMPTPSPQDKSAAITIFEAFKIIGIKLVDFAIVSADKKIYSFSREQTSPFTPNYR